jgi:hypothetical protein
MQKKLGKIKLLFTRNKAEDILLENFEKVFDYKS